MRQFWLVPRTLLVDVTAVTVAVSKDVVVIVVTGTRDWFGAILLPVKRREMTLAGQYLLLQVLIVLAVLVAVGAISIAQSARSFERSEIRPALSAAENLAGRPVVREQMAASAPRERVLAASTESASVTAWASRPASP